MSPPSFLTFWVSSRNFSSGGGGGGRGEVFTESCSYVTLNSNTKGRWLCGPSHVAWKLKFSVV